MPAFQVNASASGTSQISDFAPQSYSNEPLVSGEMTSLVAIRAFVAALQTRRDANTGYEASGTTISPRFRAALTRASLELSTFRPIALVTHAAPTGAVDRTAESALRTL